MSKAKDLGDFYIERLQKVDLDGIVAMIHANLNPFEEAGSVLAAAYRRLNNFWNVYNQDGAAYWVLKRSQDNTILGGAGLDLSQVSQSRRENEARYVSL